MQRVRGYVENSWSKEKWILITKFDRRKLTRGYGYKGIVTDVNTDTEYFVFGETCGGDCVCAIRIKVRKPNRYAYAYVKSDGQIVVMYVPD